MNITIFLLIFAPLLGIGLTVGGAIFLYKKLNQSKSASAVLWMVPFIIVMSSITVTVLVLLILRASRERFEKMTASTIAVVTDTKTDQTRVNGQWIPEFVIRYQYTVNNQTFKGVEGMGGTDSHLLTDYVVKNQIKVCYDPAIPESAYVVKPSEECGQKGRKVPF